MALITSRAVRLAAMVVCGWAFQPRPASAQANGPTPPPLSAVRAAVPADGVVHVTDIHGRTITGVLGSVTSESVEVTVDGETRQMFARDVRRIRWRQRDSWVMGAATGAGIGALPGVYYLLSDPNECAGLCPEEFALIGIGALVGALVDTAITRTVTVYENPTTGGAGGNVALTPVLAGAYRGLHVTVRF
jgi:hypothetical protein